MATCKRCKKTDVAVLSNGYCDRCDEQLYGRKIDGFKPFGTSPYSTEPKWYGFRYRSYSDGDSEQPCLVEQCIADQKRRGVSTSVAMVVCRCPKCRRF